MGSDQLFLAISEREGEAEMTDDLLGRQTQHLYHLLSLKLLGRQHQGMVFSILHVYLFVPFSASRIY